MKNDAGKYDSYSDGGLPNGPRQEPAPPRATPESERRDQLYKVWLNYNRLPGNVESRKVFDSACAILAFQGAPVFSADNALPELPEPWQCFQLNRGWNTWENVIPGSHGEPGVEGAYTADQIRAYGEQCALAALASQSTPVAPVVEQAREDGSINGFFPDGIAHLQPTLRVACVTLDGTTLTVPVEELGDVLHEEGEHTYTVTLKTMTRRDYEALGEFDGF